MKTVTRPGVFETNSSSTHSISLPGTTEGWIMDTSFLPNEDGILRVPPGEFGWEWETYSDARTKASYAAIYAMDWAGDSKEIFLEVLRKVLRGQTLATEVVFDISSDWKSPHHSYIDHQSVEDRDLDYLFKDPETLRQFIFDKRTQLRTGNDNEDSPYYA